MLRSFKWRIMLYFGVATTVIFAVGLVMIQWQITNTNIPLTEKANQQVISAKADELGGWIQKRVSELRIITEVPEITEMDRGRFQDFLREMDQSHKKDYESFALVDTEGKAWVTNDTFIDVSDRPYFEEIKKPEKDYAISDPILSHSNQEPIIVIIHKIYRDQEVVGYVNGAIYLENFSRIAKEITMYDGNAWLVDSKGQLFSPEAKPYDGGAKSPYLSPEGREIIHASIPNTRGWSLGIDFSTDLMRADTNRLLYLVFLLGGVMIVMLFVVSWVLAKSITDPIRRLQNQMALVQQGNFDVFCDLKRKDEIGLLGKRFNQMIAEIKRLSQLFRKEQKEKRQAELGILHAQIQPHFLYNTLDAIRWSIIENEKNQSVELLEVLSTYYRIGLNHGEEWVSLEKELDHIEAYLRLIQARYEDRLDYRLRYDEELLNCKVLKLTLQPLVENAVLHGFKQRKDQSFTIVVHIFKEGGELIMSIEDTGPWISENNLEKIKNNLSGKRRMDEEKGFGLYSTNRRVQLTFGEDYGLSFRRKRDKTIVEVRHPCITEETETEPLKKR
nr:sensor histidine kinase [Isachenkonia alkalipeptolytica]